MASSLPSWITSEHQQVLRDAIDHASQTLSQNLRPEDYFLLPLILLGGAYIYNKGSVLPKGGNSFDYKLFEKPQELMNGGIVHQKSTRNVAEKIKETNADLVIFWGSQSGVAEGFAHRLTREFKHRFKLNALVADLSDYEPETIAQIPRSKLAIFVMSTYGEGDPSDNSEEFVAWVKSSKCGRASLSEMRFAAFGCGNRNYRFYNKVIDDVVAAVEGSGAVALLPTGKGDEAARTTQEDFLEWKEKLFSVLKSKLKLEEHEMGYEAGVDVVFEDQAGDANMEEAPLAPKTGKNSPIVAAPLSMRKEIASYGEQNRSCVHVELDLSKHRQVKYKTGDHIAVWPVNAAEDVDALLNILGLAARKYATIRISPRVTGDSDKLKVPSSTTVEALLKHHLEIAAAVPRETVLFLSEFAPTEKIKAELIRIAKDKNAYATFLESNYLTLSRLLAYTMTIDPSVVSWSNLPLSFVIDVLPAMKPRTYSIASSPAISPRTISLTVSVKPTELLTQPDTTIPGLASTFLSKTPTITPGQEMDTSLAASSNIHVQIRPSTFKLPFSLNVPVIMVAAGSGIAPFRAFIQDRAHVASVGRDVAPMMLFFGCQGEGDYLYRDQLMELQKGPLKGKLDLIPAFSRGGKGKKASKEYVDKKVASRAADLGHLLLDDNGASFYICGAATMAKSVREVVRGIVKESKGWTDDEAENWRLGRKKDNRWFEDVWS